MNKKTIFELIASALSLISIKGSKRYPMHQGIVEQNNENSGLSEIIANFNTGYCFLTMTEALICCPYTAFFVSFYFQFQFSAFGLRSSVLQSCGRAVVRSCGHAVVRSCGLRASGFGLRASGFDLAVLRSRGLAVLRSSVFRLRSSVFGLRSSDFGLPSSVFRLRSFF